MYEIDNF